MAKLFYSVSGEGRGHATRAATMIEELRNDHEIVVYAPDLGYELLRTIYGGSEIEVRRVPGVPHVYTRCNRMAPMRTGWNILKSYMRSPITVRRFEKHFERAAPDLVITDFEPVLPRAAKRCGVPFVSLTHQHFLKVSDLSALPASLQRHAWLCSKLVDLCYQGQADTIVSSFYFPPLKPRWRDVTQVGVLLRPEILNARPEVGDHLVVYLRRFASPEVMHAIEVSGREAHVYGLGAQPSRGRLQFHAVDPDRFVEHLATCKALVSTAGNQLVGEALYLGKPVLAFPEPGQKEQYINGHYLQASGAGSVCEMDQVMPATVLNFLKNWEAFRSKIDRSRLCGNQAALNAIRRNIPQGLSMPAPAISIPPRERVAA